MTEEAKVEHVRSLIGRINQAWLDGRVDDLAPMLHPDIVMVFPGFGGRVQGREELLGGFRDFCQNARTLEFTEQHQQIDVVGDAAVATFIFEMLYEREGRRYQSSGRDLWVFHNQDNRWIAIWRTMLDVEEREAS